jgi:RNA polymerase sigma-70 factor (sigma-E family)
VLLGDVALSDPRDELLSTSADVISSGGGWEDFTAFAQSRWPRLLRLAYGLTGDPWTAEDVTQTTLARVYVSWRRVCRADDPDAYVRRVLINTSNRRFRRHRVAEEPGDLPEGMTALTEQGHAEAVADRAALLAALRGLPRRQRAVVVLRFWEDLTDIQIAAALGCSASTVRSQLARALARLRADFGKGDDEWT